MDSVGTAILISVGAGIYLWLTFRKFKSADCGCGSRSACKGKRR